MRPSPPPGRRDVATWISAALVTACALAIGVSVMSKSLETGERVALSGVAPLHTSPAVSGSIPPTSRATAFQARMAAFGPLEAQVWRAFFPPPPAPVRRSAPTGRRIARGGDSQTCLAQAVYYEARGEPAEGQAAVAQVVMNRTRSPGRPPSVCGVVFEGASHAGCQFSFACDSRLGGHRVDAAAWRRAETVADAALAGREAPELRTAVNYHADYVHPGWAGRFQRTAEIGRHIFYAATAPAARAWSAWTSPPPAAPAATD